MWFIPVVVVACGRKDLHRVPCKVWFLSRFLPHGSSGNFYLPLSPLAYSLVIKIYIHISVKAFWPCLLWKEYCIELKVHIKSACLFISKALYKKGSDNGTHTGPGQFFGGSILPPLVTKSRTSWLLRLGYGIYPIEKISHSSTPKDLSHVIIESKMERKETKS